MLMDLTPQERERIYLEEKARIEARTRIAEEIDKAEKESKIESNRQSKTAILILIAVIVLAFVFSAIFLQNESSLNKGKDLDAVLTEVDNTFNEYRLVDDSADKKVWLGKIREGSKTVTMLTATRLPNGYWTTSTQPTSIPVN